jgi:hypothetical protein
MIGQYFPNNNETVTVSFRQKFYQLNSPLVWEQFFWFFFKIIDITVGYKVKPTVIIAITVDLV